MTPSAIYVYGMNLLPTNINIDTSGINNDGIVDSVNSSNSSNASNSSNNPGPEKLPPCSELRKQLADGTYKPSLTVESFIPGETESGFHGDGRGFLDSPSNPVDGTTSRVSVTSNYHSTFDSMMAGSNGPEFSEVDVTSRVGTSWLTIAPSHPLTGTVSPQTFNMSYNNVVYMNVGYSSTNPFGPSGLMQMVGMDIRSNVGVQIDLNTGMLTGSVTRSAFPASQVFLNGQSIYKGDASAGGAKHLPFDVSGKIDGVPVCDPSR